VGQWNSWVSLSHLSVAHYLCTQNRIGGVICRNGLLGTIIAYLELSDLLSDETSALPIHGHDADFASFIWRRLPNSPYLIATRITPTQSSDRSDTRLYQMFFVWFSANFNILAFSTGSAAPAFFNLGLKHTGIIVVVVDSMWVVASGDFLYIHISDPLLAQCAEMSLMTFTSVCCCSMDHEALQDRRMLTCLNLSSISRSCSIPAYLCVYSRLKFMANFTFVHDILTVFSVILFDLS